MKNILQSTNVTMFGKCPIMRSLSVFCLCLVTLGSIKAQETKELDLRITQTSNGQTLLNWTKLPGDLTYSVETKSTIHSPWSLLSPSSLASEFFIAPNSPQGFYRVIAQPSSASADINRGRLIASEKVGEVPSLTLQFLLLLLPGLPPDADRSVPFNVDLYKITYETVDPAGQSTVASAGLAFPQGVTEPIPVASYQHPTVLRRTEVPSNPESSENLGGVFMAAGGFFTVMPDYLGLGESDLFHPFVIAKPTAIASVDALRAARTFASNQSMTTTDELFLLGYSEGGYATMALHRELQESHSDEFTVSASAPMAGPFDLSGTVRDGILNDETLSQPYQLPYVVGALTHYEPVGLSFADTLRDDLATTIPRLFNGEISGTEINEQLPSQPFEILSDAALSALADPTHPLVLALQRNDLLDWIPAAPMRLIHCSNDEVVSFQNSQRALEEFQNQGADAVELVDPGMDLGHLDCAIPSIVAARQWINSLR
jgi:pimeloyl-ACP methyl ester carboxylesterase